MVGDVNLFLSDGFGELELMIAESNWRRRGLGQEAVRLMLFYAVNFICLEHFQVKISRSNKASLAFFEKLGFVRESYSGVFDEHTLVAVVKNGSSIFAGLQYSLETYTAQVGDEQNAGTPSDLQVRQ